MKLIYTNLMHASIDCEDLHASTLLIARGQGYSLAIDELGALKLQSNYTYNRGLYCESGGNMTAEERQSDQV